MRRTTEEPCFDSLAEPRWFFYSPSHSEPTRWGARSLLHKGQPALLPRIKHQKRDDKHSELVDWEPWDSWEILLTKIRKESSLPVIYSRGTIPVLFQYTSVLLAIRVLNMGQSFSFAGMVIHTRSFCIFGRHESKRGGATATFSFKLGTRSIEVVDFINGTCILKNTQSVKKRRKKKRAQRPVRTRKSNAK